MPKNKPTIPATFTPNVGPFQDLTDADLAKIKVGDVFYYGQSVGDAMMVVGLPKKKGDLFKAIYLDDPHAGYTFSPNTIKGGWSKSHPNAAHKATQTLYEAAAQALQLPLATPKTPKTPAASTYNPKIGQYQAVTMAELKKLKPGDMVFVTEKKGTPAIVTSIGKPGAGGDKTGIKIVYLDDPGMGEFEINKYLLSEYSKAHPNPQTINPADYDQVLTQYNITPKIPKPVKAPKVTTPAAIPTTYTAKIGPAKAVGKAGLKKLTVGTVIYGKKYGTPYMIMELNADGSAKLIELDGIGGAFSYHQEDIAKHTTLTHPSPGAVDWQKYQEISHELNAAIGVAPPAPAAGRIPTYKPNFGQWEKAGPIAKSLLPGAVVYGQAGSPFLLIATPAESAKGEWEFKNVISGKVVTYPDTLIGTAGVSLQHPNPTQITQEEFKEAFKAVVKPAQPIPVPAPIAPQMQTPAPPSQPSPAAVAATPVATTPTASPGMVQKIDDAAKAALKPGRIIYTTTGVPLIVTELISPPGKTGIGIAAISAVDGQEWWIADDSKMNLYSSHDKPKPIDPTHYATAQQIIGGGTATAPAPVTPTPQIVAPAATTTIIQTPIGAFQHNIGQFKGLDWDEVTKLPDGTVVYFEVQGGGWHPAALAGYSAQAKLIDVDDLYDGYPNTLGPGAISLTAPNPEDPDPQVYKEIMGPKQWIKGQPLPMEAIGKSAWQGISEGFVPPVGEVVVSIFGTPCIVTAPYDPQTKEIEVANLGNGKKVQALLNDISYNHLTPQWQEVNQQVLDDLMAEIQAKYAPIKTSQATPSPIVNQAMAQKHYPVPPGLSAANWTKVPTDTQKSIWQHIQSIAGTPKKPQGMPQQINTGWATLSLWEKKTLAAMQAVSNGDPTPPAKASLPKTTDLGNIKWASHQSVALQKGVFTSYVDSLVANMEVVQPNPLPPGPIPVPPPKVPVTAPIPPPIAQMPTEMQYWEGMSQAITLASTPAAYNAVMAGANSAYEMGVDVDFEGIHREALHITKTTVPMMAALMTETTRNAVQAALLKYQTEGLGKRGLPDLIAELQASTAVGFDRNRARKVAVTEVTRLFAEGNRLATLYDDSIGGLQWQAAADELMCPVCGERHMKIYPKASPPPCPAHVLCRCGLIPATWDYIRQNPSAWQGGPIPPAEAQLSEPQAVTAPQIVPPESEAEFPWKEADLTPLPRGNIGGGHEKYLYQAPDGSKWLYKPDETAGIAELAAYRMMHYAGLEVPETYFMTMQGRLGTVQRWHKDIKGGVTDATIPSLTPAQIGQTQALHVADWIVSQHDTNQGALLMNQAGGIIAIDKGQAWKFLGKDKLDYHYNPNADRQVWGAFFGNYVNGKIDMDRAAAFDQIKKFQAIPENTMRAILGGLAKQQVKLGVWKSEEDFIETILHRQQNLDSDFEKFYTGIEAERRAWDIAHGVVASKLRPDAAIPIDQAFVTRVNQSGAWGQSILVAGDKIENGNLLAYEVVKGNTGGKSLVVEMKIRPTAEAAMLAKVGKTNTGGAVQTEPNYDKILPAIKHINHHLTDKTGAANDGKIEEAKIGGLVQAATTLKSLGSSSPIYQHYSTVLQQLTGHSIDQIAGVSAATLHGWIKAHYPDWYKQSGAAANLTEYKAPPPTQPSGPAAPIQAADVVPWHLEMKVENGELKTAATPGKKTYHSAKAGFEADLGDGITAVYTMHGAQNPYSQQGRMQIHLNDWKGDPRQIEQMLTKLDKLGLETELATKEDAKLTYLYQMAHSMGLRQKPEYQTEVIDPITSRNPTVAERIKIYKSFLKKNLSTTAYKQLDDEAVFMPKFDRTFKNGQRSVEGGWAYWERCDISPADLEAQMPDYFLNHSHSLSGYTGKAEDFMSRAIATNGTLSNTEERVRMDLWGSGQGASSTADMGTGGASYLFTRITQGRNTDYLFDKRLLLRTGNYSFDSDRFGDCKESSYNERYNDIPGWKKIARNGSNETLIKNSFAMFDYLHTVFVPRADRQRVIDMLRRAGIDEIRGRRIEDIVEAK